MAVYLDQSDCCCAREQTIYATPLDFYLSLELALSPALRRGCIEQDGFKE